MAKKRRHKRSLEGKIIDLWRIFLMKKYREEKGMTHKRETANHYSRVIWMFLNVFLKEAGYRIIAVEKPKEEKDA